VLDILVWFSSVTFLPAFLVAVDGTHWGGLGILTACIMLGYMHYQACIRSFGLITAMPDRVSRWFGHGGQQGQEDERHASSNIGIISSRLESNAGAAMGAFTKRRDPPPTDKTTKPTAPEKKGGKTPDASTGGGEGDTKGGDGTGSGGSSPPPTKGES
jgi:hypothetical protein